MWNKLSKYIYTKIINLFLTSKGLFLTTNDIFLLDGVRIPLYGRLKYNSLEDITLKKYCEKRDKHRRCSVKGDNHSKQIRLHHKIPLSKGGTNHPDNLEWLCTTCHKQKHQYIINKKI